MIKKLPCTIGVASFWKFSFDQVRYLTLVHAKSQRDLLDPAVSVQIVPIFTTWR